MSHGGQVHMSDPRILGDRTLESDFKHLAAMLRPGMKVLDVGCGTGTITAGMARAVQPDGEVLGIDHDAELLKIADAQRAGVPNLHFEQHDILLSPYRQQFDVVATARCLQWIGRPDLAVGRLRDAARPRGCVIALDYNHSAHAWEPEPPPEFQTFFQAFLAWRTANHWDNEIATHLPDLFRSAGLASVQVHDADEVTKKKAASLWPNVIETIGPLMVAAGFLSDRDWLASIEVSRPWFDSELRRQHLVLRAVEGRVV